MKENMNQPNHAARHSLPWHATFSWIIHSNTSKTINIKDDLSIENQTNAPHQWLYPFIVVYKRLAYLPAMIIICC